MKNLLCIVSLLGAFCAAMYSSGGLCLAQDPLSASHPHVSEDVYNQILDAVFVLKQEKTSDLQYSMVLRFMSSSHAESEVAVNVFNGGRAEAILLTATGISVWNAANEYIERTGKVDVQEIARIVQMKRQTILVSPVQASVWHSEFLKSLGQSSVELQQDFVVLKRTGETTIFLDGSTYELWFNQGVTKVHWVAMDAEVDNTKPAGRSAVAKWMNDVRRYSLAHSSK